MLVVISFSRAGISSASFSNDTYTVTVIEQTKLPKLEKNIPWEHIDFLVVFVICLDTLVRETLAHNTAFASSQQLLDGATSMENRLTLYYQ